MSVIYVVFSVGTVVELRQENIYENNLTKLIGGHKNDFNEMDKSPGNE